MAPRLLRFAAAAMGLLLQSAVAAAVGATGRRLLLWAEPMATPASCRLAVASCSPRRGVATRRLRPRATSVRLLRARAR